MRPLVPLPLLLAVSVCSGFCGLAYEQLYGRLLTTYLGDMFFVDATILAVFLGGIGTGALLSPRLRALWWCEAGAGLWAMGAALALTLAGDLALHVLPPLGALGPLAVVATVAAIAGPPALLVGAAVPWLARAVDDARATLGPGATGFNLVYALYNVGAAACVIVVELAVLPTVGMRAALAIVGVVNLVDAGLLFRARHVVIDAAPPLFTGARDKRILALVAMSTWSGLSQLFVLKTAEGLVGPFHENFALLVAGTLLGISVGSAVVERWRPSFTSVVFAASVICSLTFLAVGPLLHAYAAAVEPYAGLSSPLWLRAVVVAPLAILPAAAFGATVPALSVEANAPKPGLLLFASSMGNVIGYALAVLVVWERVPDAAIATVIPALIAATGTALAGERRLIASVVVVALALAPSALWPARALQAGQLALASKSTLAVVEGGGVTTTVRRRLGTQATRVRDGSGDETLVLDGYQSMRIARQGVTSRAELLVGAMPSLLVEKPKKAMVIGLGTGISVGAVASIFEHTRVVELSPAVMAMAPELGEHALGLWERKNVDIVLGDGLAELARDDATYDLILNTVNAPRFYASSKLYTADFFRLVRERLAPGGVYAAWIDGDAGPEGVEILARTLWSSFPSCALVSLKGAYAEVVCGEHLSTRTDLPWPPELVRALRLEDLGTSADELATALLFPVVKGPARSGNDGGPVHTLDLPRLEHVDGPSLEHFRGPWDVVTPDLRRTRLAAPLDDDGVRRRCALLERLSSPAPSPCRPWLHAP